MHGLLRKEIFKVGYAKDLVGTFVKTGSSAENAHIPRRITGNFSRLCLTH